MPIDDKYDLLEPITGVGGAQDVTVPAWEKASGRLVFIHILAGGHGAETSRVLNEVEKLAPEHKAHVLGTGDLSGSAYVVTDALPWGAALRVWLESIGGKDQVLERPADPARLLHAGIWKIPVNQGNAPMPAASAPAEPEPGEFTRILSGMPLGGESPRDDPASQVDAAPVRPGEFTMFMEAAKLAAELPAPGPAAPDVSTPAAPGEFTQLISVGIPPAAAEAGSSDVTVEMAAPSVKKPDPAPTPASPAEPPRIEARKVQFPAVQLPGDRGGAGSGAKGGRLGDTRLMETLRPTAPPAPVNPPAVGEGEFTGLFSAARPVPMPTAPFPLPTGEGQTGPTAPVVPEAGEFTRIFALPGAQGPPAVTPATSNAAPTAPEPGEFTRMFASPAAAAPPPPKPAPEKRESTGIFASPAAEGPPANAGNKPESPATLEGGEFTKMFASPAAQPPVAPPPPVRPAKPAPPMAADAGEFTRLMNANRPAPIPTSQFSSPPVVPAPPPAAAPQGSAPGEFTRMFQAPAHSPSNLPPPPQKPAGEGEFTRMMRAPSAPAGDLFNAPPSPGAADIFAARAPEVQRDEFSHLVAPSKPVQQPEASAKPAAVPAPAATSSKLPIILIVGGLLIVAIALVVVFALVR